jgi:HPt (histidine-containing phosphotransfer) domain-containing protein
MHPIDPLLSTLAGDPALLPAVTRFAAGLPARLQAITACLAAGDDAQAAELAHKLAGAAGMHGFTPIGEAARHLESLLRRGDRSALDETIGSLRTLCARARAA